MDRVVEDSQRQPGSAFVRARVSSRVVWRL